jgi:hypothetical protein
LELELADILGAPQSGDVLHQYVQKIDIADCSNITSNSSARSGSLLSSCPEPRMHFRQSIQGKYKQLHRPMSSFLPLRVFTIGFDDAMAQSEPDNGSALGNSQSGYCQELSENEGSARQDVADD